MEMSQVDFEKQKIKSSQTNGEPSAPTLHSEAAIESGRPPAPTVFSHAPAAVGNEYLNLQQQLNTLKIAPRSDIEPIMPAPPFHSGGAEYYPRYEEPNEQAQQFRLHKINEVQKILESDLNKRASLAKKYQRGSNVVSGICYVFEIAAVGLGTAGIALLTTVIAAPIVVAMEGIALSTGGLSVAGNLLCDKVFSVKTRKHNQIKMLAESKLNTIADHVSRALQDNMISDEEFALVLSELDKYYQLRDEIKSKTKSKIDNETKKSLIQQGKDQAISEFQNMIGGRLHTTLPSRQNV